MYAAQSVSEPAAGAPCAHCEDLGEDRDGGRRGRLRPRSRPGRTVKVIDLGLREAFGEQPFAATLLGAPRAERPDVERVAAQGAGERRDVESLLVGEHDDGALLVQRNPFESGFRPLDGSRFAVPTRVPRGESCPRVGDDRVPAELLRAAAERLGDIDRAEDDQPMRRRLLDEHARARSTRSARYRRRSRPRMEPTDPACSSVIPYGSVCGSPFSSTSRAVSATSLSTQPPKTDPASSPCSETASFEPTGRGAERRVARTVARAKCSSPRSRHRMSWSRICLIGQLRAYLGLGSLLQLLVVIPHAAEQLGQLRHRLALDLSDALAGDAELLADRLQRLWIGAQA